MLQEISAGSIQTEYEGDRAFSLACGVLTEYEAEKITLEVSRQTGKKVIWKKELTDIIFCCVDSYTAETRDQVQAALNRYVSYYHPTVELYYFH